MSAVGRGHCDGKIIPRGLMLPCLVPLFSAFIVDETSIFCRYVEPLQSYTLPIDGGSVEGRQNLRFFPPNFLGVG